MGGRKFRLTNRKDKERRKNKQKKDVVVVQHQQVVTAMPQISFLLSFPISLYTDSNISSLESLSSRLTSMSLPESWIFASTRPSLTLCKLRVLTRDDNHADSTTSSASSRADVTLSICVTKNMNWSPLFVVDMQVNMTECPLLDGMPVVINSVSSIINIIKTLNSARVCSGNSEKKFLDHWHQRSLTLHGSSSE